jgi:hypothetical protein
MSDHMAPMSDLHGGEHEASDVRVAALHGEMARLRVELKAVEDGTLPWLESVESATAACMASEFGLSPQGANNRLSRMVGAALATREPCVIEGGGRAYRYRVVRRWKEPTR